MPPKHPPPTDAADALVAVAPLISRWIERLLAGHQPPLTVAQYLTLRAVAAGQVSGAELARSTGVSGPAVSQLTAGLVAAGLLERRELPGDRRRRALALSRQGKRALSSANAVLRQGLAATLTDLPRPEAAALARALPHVESALAGAPPPRRPPPRPPGPPHRRAQPGH
ncbi:MAG: winged helix-turn-helix transcriptional regulator [Solirubrobacterales bacterium]|nr:winged helix-turn-helix transcriptional regulator [Solirubrobacterales bacterium]